MAASPPRGNGALPGCMCVQAGRAALRRAPDQPTTTSASPAASARRWSELLNTRTCEKDGVGGVPRGERDLYAQLR